MNNIVLSKLMILLVCIFAVGASYVLIGKLLIILLPFILGYFVSKLINPAVTLLHTKLKIPRGFSALVLLLLTVFVLGFSIYALIAKGAEELLELSMQINKWSSSIITLSRTLADSLDKLNITTSATFSEYLSTAIQSILSNMGKYTGVLGSDILSAVTSLPNVLFFIVIVFVSAFFMTKDKDRIALWLQPVLLGKWTQNEKVIVIRDDVIRVLFGYIKAQLILMSFTFIESSIGLWLIGIRYPIPIAFGIALIDALPVLGPATIYIPWCLVKLALGDYVTAFSLFMLYLLVTLARQALEPKILSSQIGVYPLLTLLSMYIGLKTIGFIGIILGPVTFIIILSLFKTGILPKPAIFEPYNAKSNNNSD